MIFLRALDLPLVFVYPMVNIIGTSRTWEYKDFCFHFTRFGRQLLDIQVICLADSGSENCLLFYFVLVIQFPFLIWKRKGWRLSKKVLSSPCFRYILIQSKESCVM